MIFLAIYKGVIIIDLHQDGLVLSICLAQTMPTQYYHHSFTFNYLMTMSNPKNQRHQITPEESPNPHLPL